MPEFKISNLINYIKNPPELLKASCLNDLSEEEYEKFTSFAVIMISSYGCHELIQEKQQDAELMEYMASQPSKPHLICLSGGAV